MAANFDVIRVRSIFKDLYNMQIQNSGCVTEYQEAVLFAKAIYIDQVGDKAYSFCKDNEFFVSKTPTGYAIAGFYDVMIETGGYRRNTFNITVCKRNGDWNVSGNYVSPDTKSVSGFIGLWILLMIGCSIFGLISYLILKASIGF